MSGHDLIFQKIMMMVGIDSLESLHKCRQVCTTWNAMIIRNIWENPNKRNIIITSDSFNRHLVDFKMRIERNWGLEILPSDEDISRAKWLGNKTKYFRLRLSYEVCFGKDLRET